MDYLKPVVKELKSQIAKIEDIVDVQMHENEKWIRNTIKDRWALGLKPDGSIIGLYRSEDYAEQKYAQNSKAGFGNVDLTLTGSLVRGIKISGFNSEYEIFSSDSKYEEIAEKYGYYNFNISDEQREELFNKILVVILEQTLTKSYELL